MSTFANLYDPGYWIFDVVAPERALKKDLFATPCLPEPVLKLLGKLSRVLSVKEMAYKPSLFKIICGLWPPTFLSLT
ncbi:hypothetical protein [Methylobacter sp.]|uniref:hypothetical protein n=1 Tax=Methylobacter sp. TaxID=2051955 RepID=UPI002FDD41A1